MNPQQIHLARHALGLPNGRHRSYRNHFCAGRGHQDYGEWVAMVAAGCARRGNGSALSGGDDIFWLTLAGARLALKPRERLDLEDFPQASEGAVQ